jgi:hypothetical protein
LGDALRDRSCASGRQEVRHEVFAQPRRFVSEIHLVGITQPVVAIRQEEMRRVIGVVA